MPTFNLVAKATDLAGNAASATVPITVNPPIVSGGWPVPPEYVGLPQLNDYGFTDAFPPLTGNGEAKIGAWTIQPRGGAAFQSSDTTEPISPPSVLQMDYKTGFVGGSGPSNAWLNFPAMHEIYFGFSWRCSAGWQGHPSNVNKLCFLYTKNTADPAKQLNLVPEMYGPVSGPFKLRTALWELGGTQVQAWAEPNVATATLVPGTWYRIGVYCLIKPGNTGILRQYVNNTLVTQYTNVWYDPGGFITLSLNPTWGGDGGTKTRDDWFRYGHVHIRAA